MTDLNIDGMAIAPGVIEKIVAIAVKEVEGVASVGTSATDGIRAIFSSKSRIQGIEINADENNALHIVVHIEVYSGYVLPEVAEELRSVVADAVKMQVGLTTGNVDVYVDGIRFTK